MANLERKKIRTTYGHVNGAELAIKALWLNAAAAVPKIVELYISGHRPNMAASNIAMRPARPGECVRAHPVRQARRQVQGPPARSSRDAQSNFSINVEHISSDRLSLASIR